ncbi:uncharacterized protein LOC109809720 [Cajanus cajan]|uniref:IST1-like protein n=1 Tax=Cajanus cajan TaxID=3821 RepID=A0A151SHH3_CAJCA|nr:uncharacterized protein LOC109809720 [Cajanus cajan]KYP54208.1 IST1-like protein [Cajanus cajan]
MFRWLFKPRFYSKCLSYVKFLKSRLEIIQKKKKAVQKFLKSDLAVLLRSGYDFEAYKRAEWFLLEQNMLSCYKLIEKFVGCISDHVEELTKEKDCPDECKEAVPSLVYAAARFADLPELRDLRTIFTEKFGNSLEPFINKEFVEKLRCDPPSREMKIKLLYDIAQEFSIEWDDKALSQGLLYTQSSLCEERPNPGGNRNSNTSKGKERDTLPLRSKEFNDDSWIHRNSSDDETSTSQEKGSSSNSLESISEDEVESKRPNSYWFIPPPYLKQKTDKGESNSTKTTQSEALPKKESKHPRSVRKDSVADSKTSLVRGNSVPSDPTTAVETSKGHVRTISLGSRMRGGASHVHPNLPDYDELKARFAALRQK